MGRAEGFAAIPNWMIRDKEISARNILVYASLASRSGLGGIFPLQTTVAEETGLSERTVRTALQELEQLGVVERVQRRGKAGRATGLTTMYTLHPNGRVIADEGAATIAGRSKGPATSDVATGNELQAVPLIEVEPLKKMGFAEFYMAYPRKVGKEAARRAFEKAAKTTDPDVIVAGARRYAADPNLPERQFIPHPSSWLNAGRWDDEPEVPREGSSPTPGAVGSDDVARQRDEWLRRHGITYDEYLEHVDEPGWLEQLERRVQ